MQTALAPMIRFTQAAQGTTEAFWRFSQALKGLSGTPRAERGLGPYTSPKKEWDHPTLAPTFELITTVEPSNRGNRGKRQRDLTAMGKKGNRKALQQRFAQHQMEQDFRGMARVRLLGRGTPAMQENVAAAVYSMAVKEVGLDAHPNELNLAVDRIDGMLHDVADAYGDLD